MGAPGGIYADPKDFAAEPIAERGARAVSLQRRDDGEEHRRHAGRVARAAQARHATASCSARSSSSAGRCSRPKAATARNTSRGSRGRQRRRRSEQFVRTPTSPDQAREQVRQLKAAGVDAIKAVLESGRTGMLFARMDLAMFRAVVEESTQQQLPSSVHTGNARDVEDAVDAGASSIEHGSFSDAIPDAVLARMAKNGVAYDPTLSVLEGDSRPVGGPHRPAPPLAGAAGGVAEAADRHGGGDQGREDDRTSSAPAASTARSRSRKDNLRRAWKAGVPLVTGSDAGNMLVFHGPTVHRELQLWVEAGIPPAVALQAATLNAAKLLRAEPPHRPRRVRPRRQPAAGRRRSDDATSARRSGSRWSC